MVMLIVGRCRIVRVFASQINTTSGHNPDKGRSKMPVDRMRSSRSGASAACGRCCIDHVLIGRVHCVATMHEAPASPLASIRKRHLLSQRALAQKAGVALSTIYLLE